MSDLFTVPAPPAPSTDPDATTNAVASTETVAPGGTESTDASFSAGLGSTDLQSELEKRKARAARFGASVDVVGEADKVAQRAQRFGLSGENPESVKGLDQALPERRERKAGRGGRGGGFGRGGRDRRRGHTPRIGEKGQIQKQPSNVMSEKDRLAVEARKKRFAQA